jgi:hypothetical protein
VVLEAETNFHVPTSLSFVFPPILIPLYDFMSDKRLTGATLKAYTLRFQLECLIREGNYGGGIGR